jgi:hypothetical protein
MGKWQKKTKHGLDGGTQLNFPETCKAKFSATLHAQSAALIIGAIRPGSELMCLFHEHEFLSNKF